MMLRDYQREAIDIGVYGYFQENDGNPLLVLPTGAGKSHIIAALCHEALTAWPDQRIIMLTHVKELIEQNFLKLMGHWPEAPAGIYSAGLNQRDTQSRILYASIQSVYKRAAEIGHCDLAIIDEAHLIPHSGDGMYRQFLEDMAAINPKLKVLGLTATPFRMATGDLTHGDSAIFTDISYDLPMLRLIAAGHLVPVVAKQTDAVIDISGVRTRAGEFVAKDLEAAADQDNLTYAAVTEILHYGASRESWLIFCSGVDHAHHVRDHLIERGVISATITADTPAKERDRFIRDYKAGRIRALTNCDVLTTGFDAPATDLIAFLRPTNSPGLYVQMAGRGMRPVPGKKNCMILDFAGNVARHGPVDEVQPWVPGKKKGGEAPTKVCPDCKTIVHAAKLECPECGHLFPARKPKHDPTASELAILSPDVQAIKEYPITDVRYSRHSKTGKPDSMRVTYMSGWLAAANEWICFEHGGYATQKAHAWWKRRSWSLDVPATTAEALSLAHTLDKPSSIVVNTRGKYPEVISHEFESDDTGSRPTLAIGGRA